MRVCVLGSGSSGNSTFIEHQSTRLLIDAGLRAKELVDRLARINVDPSTLDGIFISHEHHDHISGAGPARKKVQSTHLHISARARSHFLFSPAPETHLDWSRPSDPNRIHHSDSFLYPARQRGSARLRGSRGIIACLCCE